MRYPPALLDDIRARLPVSQVVSRKVALKRAGREFKGLSPFKVEKSPSFFVNDHKGFYHCFASGEHGDIFTFVMKTEGLSFTEAVERLAEEAGVPLPKPTVQDREREDERGRLYALLEEAAGFFENQLAAGSGAEARRYLLEKRRLARETISGFRIGYAPNSRHALKDFLATRGYTQSEMAVSGMLIAGDDIPVSYDRFRHRVIFPIADQKGRVIAFGGRALDAAAPAKYLNSPETPLFHKGHVLFNAAKARPFAFDNDRIIVVEGYMDVVALSQAGFGEAVAPLGTALTEDQMKLLWRYVPEPILCFDGDSAGRKAAFRAVETVMPHLKPGVSLSFAFMPEGLDPDDLLRDQGADAMRSVLDRARPLADVLFEREWAQGDWSTPERRARLDVAVSEQVRRIEDQTVRAHYQQEMRRRLAEAWGTSHQTTRGAGGYAGARSSPQPGGQAAAPMARGGQFQQRAGRPHPGAYGRAGNRNTMRGGAFGGGGFPQPRPVAGLDLKRSRLVTADGSLAHAREALILCTVLNHAWLLEEHAEGFAALPLTSAPLAHLRDGILQVLSLELEADERQTLADTEASTRTGTGLDPTRLRSTLQGLGLGQSLAIVDRAMDHTRVPFVDPSSSRIDVERGWTHTIALHERGVTLQKALSAAEQAFHDTGSDDALEQIRQIKIQLSHFEEVVTATDEASTQHAS